MMKMLRNGLKYVQGKGTSLVKFLVSPFTSFWSRRADSLEETKDKDGMHDPIQQAAEAEKVDRSSGDVGRSANMMPNETKPDSCDAWKGAEESSNTHEETLSKRRFFSFATIGSLFTAIVSFVKSLPGKIVGMFGKGKKDAKSLDEEVVFSLRKEKTETSMYARFKRMVSSISLEKFMHFKMTGLTNPFEKFQPVSVYDMLGLGRLIQKGLDANCKKVNAETKSNDAVSKAQLAAAAAAANLRAYNEEGVVGDDAQGILVMWWENLFTPSFYWMLITNSVSNSFALIGYGVVWNAGVLVWNVCKTVLNITRAVFVTPFLALQYSSEKTQDFCELVLQKAFGWKVDGAKKHVGVRDPFEEGGESLTEEDSPLCEPARNEVVTISKKEHQILQEAEEVKNNLYSFCEALKIVNTDRDDQSRKDPGVYLEALRNTLRTQNQKLAQAESKYSLHQEAHLALQQEAQKEIARLIKSQEEFQEAYDVVEQKKEALEQQKEALEQIVADLQRRLAALTQMNSQLNSGLEGALSEALLPSVPNVMECASEEHVSVTSDVAEAKHESNEKRRSGSASDDNSIDDSAKTDMHECKSELILSGSEGGRMPSVPLAQATGNSVLVEGQGREDSGTTIKSNYSQRTAKKK